MRRRDLAKVLELHPEELVPQGPCPHCGVDHDAVSGAMTPYPKSGDIRVCSGCLGVSVYDERLQCEKWPETEPHPPELAEVLQAMRGLLS